jgi:hypothetical protein
MATAMTREQMMRMQASGRIFQERADNSLQPWGLRAQQPVLGEDIGAYRRKLLIQAKRQLPDSHPLRGVHVRQLDDDALAVFEGQIYDECKRAAYDASTVPEDAPLRRVEEIDGNGLKIVKWIGQRSFVRDFTIPGRRARIRNPDRDPGWFR